MSEIRCYEVPMPLLRNCEARDRELFGLSTQWGGPKREVIIVGFVRTPLDKLVDRMSARREDERKANKQEGDS